MATQTSNLGLTKPAYSETADIADINNNMDKVDAAVHGVQNGMAILANGNVHSAVTSGQYVYVRNHGTLAEGLYTATTNISTNATLSTSNLTAVPNNGALNTLRDDVTSLNSNTLKHKTITGNTDQNGVISTQTTKSHILAVFVADPINSFAVNEAGNNVRIYAGNNSSTTSDTLKMLANTSVTINIAYYD